MPVGIGPDGAGSNPFAFVFSGFCMDFAWHCAGRVWAGARAKAAFYRVPGAFFFWLPRFFSILAGPICAAAFVRVPGAIFAAFQALVFWLVCVSI